MTARPAFRPAPVAPTRPSASDPLLSGVLTEIWIYLGTLTVCVLLFTAGGATSIINSLSPLVITVASGVANYRMVQADRNALLTPLFVVRLIAMIMLGIGGLFHIVAPAAIRDQLDYVYMTGPEDAAKVQLVWLAGMTLIMMGIATGMRFLVKPGDGDRDDDVNDRRHERSAGVAFLVGFTGESALTLAQSLGYGLPIPSSFSLLFTAISMTGLFFLGEQFTRSTSAKLMCVAALLSATVVGLIVMNKSIVLVPALMLVLGYLRARFTFGRLIASVVLVTTLYMAINPIVFYSRLRDFRAHSLLGSGSLSERVAYLKDYADGDRIDPGGADTASYSLARLDYVMPASFVVGQYDRGVASDEIANSGYMFIPRLLWPGKPNTTNAGAQVNYLLGLQSTNQIAVTMFADVYWNLGWTGLTLMLIGGIFLGIGTVLSRRILRSGDWLMLPFVFATFRFALGLDGNFATGMMIPIVMSIGLYWGLRVVGLVLPASVRPLR